jgi:hypothetical protein
VSLAVGALLCSRCRTGCSGAYKVYIHGHDEIQHGAVAMLQCDRIAVLTTLDSYQRMLLDRTWSNISDLQHARASSSTTCQRVGCSGLTS